MDAVLVSMSCFNLLCEEADIRCGSDDVTVTYLLPNYHIYQELAAASTVLTTGKTSATLLRLIYRFLSCCLCIYALIQWQTISLSCS